MKHTPESTTHWHCNKPLKDAKLSCCGCNGHDCSFKQDLTATSSAWTSDLTLEKLAELTQPKRKGFIAWLKVKLGL